MKSIQKIVILNSLMLFLPCLLFGRNWFAAENTCMHMRLLLAPVTPELQSMYVTGTDEMFQANFGAFHLPIASAANKNSDALKEHKINLPLYDVLNAFEGHFFNRLNVFLDDYRGNGHAGAPSWIKLGNTLVDEFDLPHVKNPSNRWHVQNIESKGVDLRVNQDDPRKVALSIDFETEDKEIICITRISKNIDQALSGHIRHPKLDISMTLKNSGNWLSYDVTKVSWKGDIDINLTVFGLVDNLINKKVKPRVNDYLKNVLNGDSYKRNFRTAFEKMIRTANQRFKQEAQRLRISNPTITRLQIEGKNLVVYFR